ncbi:cysteine desulfurase [Serinibacter arcticus]|uniref:Cysteine desulfurase n=1 Tax=Serinibacter arcticus TaxID=1655435 RepID=A0A2U1ZSK3_9MICO|nr:SufS family cysteine desulfurase [Serinibacter arcticus]PWD49964.1 cysteine desulfurase [Serinibacter arcticus]
MSSPTQSPPAGLAPDELARVRADFPILTRQVHGKDLVYLDWGATSQKPECVIDAEQDFYLTTNAAVHRGAHALAEEATAAFEDARTVVASLVGAHDDEIVWTSNATAAINLVAYGISNATAGRGGEAAQRFALAPGDELVVTELEHHANLVPWQELAARTGAVLRFVPATDEGRLDLTGLEDIITDRARVVAVTHASNVTGAVTDLAPIVARAHAVGALVVLDACQSVPHLAVDLHALDVDFAAFSGHKMLGPTGIGVLYGRRELLAALPPVATGGSMVEIVTMEATTYAAPPQKFEAGTQMVAQTVGLRAAAQFLADLGMDAVEAQEIVLTQRLLDGLAALDHVRVLGPLTATRRLGVVAFELEGVHPHDVGQVLDAEGIAVRVGHHCAQPIHRRLGVASSTRASIGIATTPEDIDAFLAALAGVRAYFGLEGAGA